MFCSKCGKSLSEGSVFCKYCGTKVDAPDGPSTDFISDKKDNFITLNCPTCGGKLKVEPNTETLVCQFCGTEHLVRRAENGVTLEKFARCPTCGRNDKSVKATIKFGSPSEPTYELIAKQGWTCGSTVLVYFGISGILGYFLINYFTELPSSFKVMYFLFSFFMALLFFFLAIFPRAKANHAIEEKNLKMIEENKIEKENYKRNLVIWEKMFYCERDDTFFSIEDRKPMSKEAVTSLFPYWTIADNSAILDSFR